MLHELLSSPQPLPTPGALYQGGPRFAMLLFRWDIGLRTQTADTFYKNDSFSSLHGCFMITAGMRRWERSRILAVYLQTGMCSGKIRKFNFNPQKSRNTNRAAQSAGALHSTEAQTTMVGQVELCLKCSSKPGFHWIHQSLTNN